MDTEHLAIPLRERLAVAIDRTRRLYHSGRENGAEPELLRGLLDVESALLEASRCEGALTGELESLARRVEGRDRLRFDGLVCWRNGEDGQEEPFPYCASCWDADGRLIRLQRADPDYFEGWECRRCANHFGTRRAAPPYAKRDEGTRHW